MRFLNDFKGFLNEGFFDTGNELYFLFIPLDSGFNCVYSNIETVQNELPSERDNSGTAGYLLVPCTSETGLIMQNNINSPIEATHGETVGNIKYTKNSKDDGLLIANIEEQFNPTAIGSTGVRTVSAKIKGFLQTESIYLKSGNALCLELLFRRNSSFEKIKVSDIDQKVGNGYPNNIAVKIELDPILDTAVGEMREMLAAATDGDTGLKLTSRSAIRRYRVTKELLKFFQDNPSKFMALNFKKEKIERILELAKEDNDADLVQTIDNLSDLKDSGFFDD